MTRLLEGACATERQSLLRKQNPLILCSPEALAKVVGTIQLGPQ